MQSTVSSQLWHTDLCRVWRGLEFSCQQSPGLPSEHLLPFPLQRGLAQQRDLFKPGFWRKHLSPSSRRHRTGVKLNHFCFPLGEGTLSRLSHSHLLVRGDLYSPLRASPAAGRSGRGGFTALPWQDSETGLAAASTCAQEAAGFAVIKDNTSTFEQANNFYHRFLEVGK